MPALQDRHSDHRVPATATATATATTVHWASGTNIAAAAWLLVAPYLLGYGDIGAAVADATIVGLLILGMAWYRTAQPTRGVGLSWTNAVLGGWLLIAPFALGYSGTGAAVANDIIVGLIVLVLAAVSATASTKDASTGH